MKARARRSKLLSRLRFSRLMRNSKLLIDSLKKPESEVIYCHWSNRLNKKSNKNSRPQWAIFNSLSNTNRNPFRSWKSTQNQKKKIAGWVSMIVYENQISGKMPQLLAWTYPITLFKPEKRQERLKLRARCRGRDKRVRPRRYHLKLYLQHPSSVHPHLHHQSQRRARWAPCATANPCIIKLQIGRTISSTPLKI